MATMTTPEHAPTIGGDDNQMNNALNMLFARAFTINWEVVAYLIIFGLALFTRFYALGDRVMSHDESLHTRYSYDLYDRGFFEHTPLMHGPILFHFTALNYWLFGVNDFSARIYAAVMGVAIVMFPLLFRRWLGRTGAILASLMLLASPLMLYYSRYIRHDMPSILSAMVMFYAIMMYLSGPENQRRRAHWLYLLAIGMIWNLGSKETAFIYIAIFGLFLTIYWVIRLLQHLYNLPGRLIMDTFVVSGLLGGVATLAMIVVVSIALANMSLGERLTYIGEQFTRVFTADTQSLGFVTTLSWTGAVIVTMIAFVVGPALWAYRKTKTAFTFMDGVMGLIALGIFITLTALFSVNNIAIVESQEVVTNTSAPALAVGFITAVSVLLIYGAFRFDLARTASVRRIFTIVMVLMFSVLAILLAVEELSHVSEEETSTEVVAQPVPGQEGAVVETTTSDFTIVPLVIAWVLAFIVIGGLVIGTQRGMWRFLDLFPEFDVLIIMGSLILPWLTAVFIVSTRGSPEDFTSIGQSVNALSRILPVTGELQLGQFVVGFLAWLPMMAISVVAGLLWNWRRWLISFVIFHAIFAFFFTTIFTNIQGLASGMIYSLQYWLEQQEVRRGNQPQYYYLLIIMPLYEFLPIIGSVLAMIAGLVLFWRRHRAYDEVANPYDVDDDEYLADTGILETAIITEDGELETSAPPAHEAEIQTSKAFDDPNTEPIAEPGSKWWRLSEVSFLLFVAFWGVVNLFGYTLAGEKMPWLGTHLTVPLILLSGWYFGRILSQLEWGRFLERGWLYLLLLPFLIVGIFQIIGPYLGGRPPFSGTTQTELEWTYGWLAAVVISGMLVFAIMRLMEYTGWPHLRRMIGVVTFGVLLAITFRSAWLAAFINYDEATEFLVYAHAAPANKRVTEQLADLSFRITDGMDIKVMHDNKFSWPGSWYMRDFNNSIYIGENAPTLQQLDDTVAVIVGDSNRSKVEPLLEDSFQRFDHIRMWWPIQDYFSLNAESMSVFFDFSSESSGTLRRGIFDIWWERNYETYGEYSGREITLTEWPVSDRMHVYIRKDYAAQIWPYGVGDATVLNPFTEVEVNQCAANWQLRPANMVLNSAQNPLVVPMGMDIDTQGRLFVAEDAGREISIFNQEGLFVESFGQPGTRTQEGAFFERPHSVAIAPNGDIYVVDTWNFRIRRFTPNFSYVTGWGQEVTAGFEATTNPTDGFWGPRDIAIDAQNRVYISDTGNKRVRVYDANGTFIRDIGTGGTGDGQLNEPAGLEIEGDRLYVADTWNRRIAVFTLDGVFVQNFDVRGWREELGNRPYVAVDGERSLIYVTDPDAGRILVHDINGECLGSFGQLNRENPNNSEFGTIADVTLDEAGNLYVSDLATGRILRFDPYERPIVIPEANASGEQQVLPPIFGDQNDQGNPQQQSPIFQPDAETTDQVGAPLIPPFGNQSGNNPGFSPQGNPPPFAAGAETTPEITPEVESSE